MILKIIKDRGRPKYDEIESSLLQVCSISPSNVFVLLGNLVYRRWFLDGSDPDVGYVGLYIYIVCSRLGAGRGRRCGVLCLTPIFGFLFPS